MQLLIVNWLEPGSDCVLTAASTSMFVSVTIATMAQSRDGLTRLIHCMIDLNHSACSFSTFIKTSTRIPRFPVLACSSAWHSTLSLHLHLLYSWKITISDDSFFSFDIVRCFSLCAGGGIFWIEMGVSSSQRVALTDGASVHTDTKRDCWITS